ncbi:MAG: hypothetical protein WBL68_10265 [Nitrososphaeraceae archaeon]
MDKNNKSNSDGRDKRSYSDFLVGLGLGAVGVVILATIFKPRCPKCRKKILRGIHECPFCGANLQ